MGIGDAFALFAVAGMVIGLSVAGTEMFKRWLGYKEQKLAALRDTAIGGAEQRALEQRLAVLERIVTDKGYALAHQIEALRAPIEQEHA